MDIVIPPAVVYAGLGGTVLALIVATATNNWNVRVLLLLILRLAIGWHFLFEGLHKVHSHLVGPTETNRPFSSEPYFGAAEGPLGEYMRKQAIGDPEKQNHDRLTPPDSTLRDAFAKMSTAEQASRCPLPVAEALAAAAHQALPQAKEDQAKAKTEADQAQAEAAKLKTDEAKKTADAKAAAVAAAENRVDVCADDGAEMKAAFARWVYGVDARPTSVAFVTGDVMMTAPQRLAHIAWLENEVTVYEARQSEHLGHGYGTEMKRGAKLRADLTAARAELARDTDAFLADLRTVAGATAPETEVKRIVMIDRVTPWFITAIGTGLLLGLFTRVWCLAGAGFLAMTYLSHPTVPWLPLPPMTEGNPLFVNKNVIEALALLVLAAYPTGRWLGLDALLPRCFGRCAPSVAA